MALQHSPSIITDGLVLYLDAANPRSYPGAGTTWTDLSGNGNNSTLINGVGYNSGNGGFLSFNGADQYADLGITSTYFPTGSISHTLSVFLWVQSADTANHIFFGNQQISNERIYIAKNSNTWDIGWGNFPWGPSNITSGTRRAASSDWTNLAMIVSAGVANLYVNGEFTFNRTDTTVNITGTLPLGAYIFESILDTSNMKPVNMACCAIYNRALAAQEIQQNFNTLRGRFNI
jgi:hypothetical protein